MSKEDIHDLSTPLLRQRRNLMIISVLMLFVDMAGAEVKKIVFSGVSITLKEPNVVVLFMFGFLIYFLYRYYLYLSQEVGANFRETYISRLNSLSHSKLQKLKNRAITGLDEYGGDFTFEKMTKDGCWKRDVRTIVNAGTAGYGQEWGTFKIDIRQFAVKGIRALFYTLFKRSYLTDYYLPYFLAVTAIWFNYPTVWMIVGN